tara:strand:- start:1 stop:417 length:417 start_codon:yes stop_codon:yes gene_type:complete
MVVSLAAVGAAKAAPKPSKDNAMGYLLAGVVGLWLLKSAVEKVLDPFADVYDLGKKVAKTTVYVGDELTGGLQGDPTTAAYWYEVDLPFSDVQIPLVNVKESDQSWLDYTTTVDIPGIPEYNVQDAPGQLKGLLGRIF